MGGKRGWYGRGREYVEVDAGEGLVAAGKVLGVDLNPVPSRREYQKRRQLEAELAAALAAPLVPGPEHRRLQPAAAPAIDAASRPAGDRRAAHRRARSRGFLFGTGKVR